ncbi:MAG: hypothetical protein WC255_07950 [Bacteroidales bacterium]|jgi:hypothetical protein
MRKQKNFLILMLGLALILGALIVQSCCKPPLPPPPPPVEEEKDPTLEVFFPEEEIPYGEKDIVLSWTTTNAKSVYVNGVKRSGESHTILDRLFKDTTFIFKAVNIKKEVGKEITLNVGNWTSSVFGLVSYYPWRYKKLSFSNMKDEELAWFELDEEERSWVFYYHKNGVITFSSNLSTSTELWSIKNDSVLIKDGRERRLQVNEKEMILSYQGIWNGQDVWFNSIFEHASDTPTDP